MAPLLYKVLRPAAGQVHAGLAPAEVQQRALTTLATEPAFTPAYFEVADAQTLQPMASYAAGRLVLLCVAAFLGGGQLIDNVVL